MSDVIYTPRRTAWNAKWNGNSLGTVYDVDPTGIKLTLDPIRRASTGKIVLGHWASGIEGSIKILCADIGLLLQQNACPWLVSTTPVLHPESLYQNLYSYAQPLVLHPADLANTTQTEDLTLVKAVPITPINIKRDGEKDDQWLVEFYLYPDLSRLQGATPEVMYGYVGATEPA